MTTTDAPASTKRCPYCAEEIQQAAIVCKHCGRDLNPKIAPVGGSAASAVHYQRTNEWNPGVAALLSFLIPGAGQLYKGQAGRGVGFFLGTAFGYLLFIVPGIVMHLIAIIDALNSSTAAKLPAHLGGVTCVECKWPGNRSTNYCLNCGHVFGTPVGAPKIELVTCVECKSPGIRSNEHCLQCGHVFGTPVGSPKANTSGPVT